MPERIQLRRVKGWRKPPDAITVARPTKWGNPFKVGEMYPRDSAEFWFLQELAPVGSASLHALGCLHPQQAVDAYFSYLLDTPHLWLAVNEELAGHDLACWCPPDQPCHADILLMLANP